MTKKIKAEDLPYRPCVGIMVLNKDGLVWAGRRIPIGNSEYDGSPQLWQMPQGGIDKGEDPEKAAYRELYEETRLRAIQTVFLFRHTSLANDHAVFWVLADGHPQPSEEVDQLAYYRPGLVIKVSPETETLLKHVYHYKATHPEVFHTLNTIHPVARI